MEKYRFKNGCLEKLQFSMTVKKNGRIIRRANGKPFCFWVKVG